MGLGSFSFRMFRRLLSKKKKAETRVLLGRESRPEVQAQSVQTGLQPEVQAVPDQDFDQDVLDQDFIDQDFLREGFPSRGTFSVEHFGSPLQHLQENTTRPFFLAFCQAFFFVAPFLRGGPGPMHGP